VNFARSKRWSGVVPFNSALTSPETTQATACPRGQHLATIEHSAQTNRIQSHPGKRGDS